MSEYITKEALRGLLKPFKTPISGVPVMAVSEYAINAIPAADVEPVVRGEWIEHYDECECPVCGETWNYCDNDTERFDCCPKCGARLVEHGKER